MEIKKNIMKALNKIEMLKNAFKNTKFI